MICLRGKNSVVTGAARGIGMEIANKLRSLGSHVVGIDKIGDSRDEFCIDLTKQQQIEKMCAFLKKSVASVDILVNCAGITMPSENELYPIESWKKTLEVNLDGAFLLTRQLLPFLKKSKCASIINITSLNASLGFPNNPAYVASKTGLLGLTRAWAVDWGCHGIRSNCVAPGYIKTQMTEHSWLSEEFREKRASKTCLGRWGETKEIANVVAFLASDISSYITGQMINVDGGWTARGL